MAYDAFDRNCIRIHNKLRALHNVSALHWSESLAQDAQTWAENLASTDRAEHDYQDLITKGQGENIAWMAGPVERCQVPPKPGCISCEDIVRKWYSEKKNYDFQKGAPISVGQSTSHFNQVILFLMIISLINTYSCTYIFFFLDTSMCMASKKRKAYLQSAADFLGL